MDGANASEAMLGGGDLLPVALAIASAAITVACAAIVASRAARVEAARWYVVLLVSQALASIGFAFETRSTELSDRIFWDDAQYFPLVVMLPAVVGLAHAFTDRPLRRKWIVSMIVAAAPLAATIFVCTAPWHGLARNDAHLVQRGSHVVLDYAFAPIELAALAVMYLVVVYALVLVAMGARGGSRTYFFQSLAVSACIGLPLVGFVSAVLGLTVLGQRDVSPFLYGGAGLVATWALWRGRLFDLVPTAIHAVVEQTSEAVLALDDRGRVVHVNPAARALLATVGDPIGLALAELGAGAATISQALESGDGRDVTLGERTFDLLVSPIQVRGEKRGVVLRLVDVTLRRSAEQALRDANARLESAVTARTSELAATNAALVAENEERRAAERATRESEREFRTVFEHAVEAIATLDPEGAIESANRATVAITGAASESELLGKPFGEAIRWCAASKDALRGALDAARRGELARIDAKTDDDRTFDVSVLPVTDDGGVTIRIVSECRELTGRVHAEQERALMQKRLEDGQRLEAIGRLAGAVAHDFNNYLAVIGMSSDTARRAAGRPEAVAVALGGVDEAVASGAALVRQLLGFARREPVEAREVDLGDAVRSFRDILDRAAGPELRLAVDVQSGPHRFMIDPSQLQQILMNLVVNARDATPPGGEIRIAVGRPRVAGAGALELTVSDTGSGMPPEVAARVFEPFFTTKGDGRGTGLGLATVHGAVMRAGGTIEIESAPGSGTVMRMTFPVVERRASAATAGSS